MKRGIILILFSIILGYPTVSGAATDIFDRGQSTFIEYPFMKIPIGSAPEPKTADTEVKGDLEKKYEGEKEKTPVDKKIDDAIKKAWGEK